MREVAFQLTQQGQLEGHDGVNLDHGACLLLCFGLGVMVKIVFRR